jgi:ABC-type branched-subunit amino acid transport system substrate-binding protein
MTSDRSFPPGLGWWQAALATAAVILVAAVAAVPRFETRVVGTADAGPGGPAAQQTGPARPGASGPALVDSSGRPLVGGARGSAGPQSGGAIDCARGKNGGKTAPGVTATEINVASTVVTTGTGSGFLGQAGTGIEAALKEANAAGGVCGRIFKLKTLNTGWVAKDGKNAIEGWIHAGDTFALVSQPDSEGLGAAITSGVIDSNKMPVVGTDGMLQNQYKSPWVYPVAASTVANMHIIADYAVDVLHAKSFGIVYDMFYKFGQEGATAFAEQVQRRGLSVKGYHRGRAPGCSSADGAYCGISSENQNYANQVKNFNDACTPCDVVVMLLEPAPMIAWMNQEENQTNPWYGTLIGGEPLFDDGLAKECDGCGKARMMVWSGYRPAIQPFDSEKPVYTYCQQLKAQSSTADCHNEFTEGAYLGAKLFVSAVRKVGELGLPLTRDNLKTVLDTTTFDLGLTKGPISYPRLPHIANTCMTAFVENYSGTFNGWNYLQSVRWRCDRNPLQDL